MTDLLALIDGHTAARKEFFKTTQKQANLQDTASYELRGGVVIGCITRDAIMNITQLDCATVHEKQGQHKQKCVIIIFCFILIIYIHSNQICWFIIWPDKENNPHHQKHS